MSRSVKGYRKPSDQVVCLFFCCGVSSTTVLCAWVDELLPELCLLEHKYLGLFFVLV